MSDWYALPEEPVEWLVDGLITTDDCAAANGKPKSGKSTGIRNLIAAVVLGGKFLNRDVCIPPGTGRVLYVHLDRKDRKHRVAKELRQLGITLEASSRVRLLTEKDMPKDAGFDSRCQWLADEVASFKPNLVVIDLLLHFVRTKKGVNDYDTMIDAVAQLQDTLSGCDYRGALLVSLHARKALGEDVGDSVLGSTGIRGSLSTLLHFHLCRKEKIYTVQSDQSVRDYTFGELDETIVNRDAVTGVISLGAKYEDVKAQDKKDEWTLRRSKILGFIKKATSGQTVDAIAATLNMATKTVRPILEALEKSSDIRSSGVGVKGDPCLYFGDVIQVKPPVELPAEPTTYIPCADGDCTTQVSMKGEFCDRHRMSQGVTCVNL
jgi:AAA domain